MKLSNLWKTGLRDDMDLEERKRLMFSNGVYTIVAFILILQELVSGGIFRIFSETTFGTLIPFILIGFTFLCLSLNSLHFYLTSRIIFMTGWTFLVSVLPVIYHGPSQTTYFTHPFYIILSSPLIHLLFSPQKERIPFFLLLAVSFFLTLFSADFLLAYDPSPVPTVPLVRSVLLMKITFAVLWIYINLLMAYVIKINWDFYSALKGQKELVGQQQLLVQQQNEELSHANKELAHLNEQIKQLNEILEKRVMERTHELTSRNKTLSDYAFMNAHLLRSPVSRIKGLINLFRITDDQEEKHRIQEILIQSAQELDDVVHSISEKLNESK